MLKKIISLFLFLGLISLLKTECQDACKTDTTIHPSLQMLPVPQGVGVNIHFYEGNEKDWSMIDKSGLGIVRMDVSWAGIEKEKGKYDFSRHDKLIEQLEHRNIRLLFIIDYGNPLYDDGLAPFSEEGRKAYIRFCSELAERYAGKQIIWELWNEPNMGHFWKPETHVDDYMAWCQAVVPIIREKDKNACIVGPAISSFDIPFLEDCFERGLLDLVDGVTVHPYRNAWLEPETALDEYEIVKTMIEQYKPSNRRIPVISGEWGYSTSTLPVERQGNYLVRQWISNMMVDIPISIWYDWHDDGQDPENIEHNFGTVFWDYKPKPAFTGMKTFIHELNGYSMAGRISLGKGNDYLVAFIKGNNIKLTLWTTDESHEISLDPSLILNRAVSQDGYEINLSTNSDFPLSNNVMIIEVSSPFPEWLQLILSAYQKTEKEAEKTLQAFLNGEFDDPFVLSLNLAMNNENEWIVKSAYQALAVLVPKVMDNQTLIRNVAHLILEKDSDVLNRRKVLNRLSRLSSVESLQKIKPLMNDPHLMQEAANYYLAMAYKLANQGKNKEAKNLLLEAAKVSRYRYAVERVLKILIKQGEELDSAKQADLSRNAGFINSWSIAGPFPNANNIAEKKSFFPEKRIDFSQKVKFDSLTAYWQKIDIEGIYAIIPFAEKFGKKQQAAYAYATIKMPERMDVTLKIGSNDGVICWINSKRVHENIIARGLVVDEDVVSTKFKKGINRILIKVPNKGANWEACVRICDAQGRPLDLNQYSINIE